MQIEDLYELDDNDLLIAYANGIPKSAEILTDRFMPKIFSQAFHRVQNTADADEITQEAMFRLWRIAPNWKHGNAKVSTWLYKVVNNLCIDCLRQKKPASIDTVPDPIDERENVTDLIINQSRAIALYNALSQLPDKQREAVSMRHLEGISNQEIAEKLELSISAVESLIARGKRKLSETLKSQKSNLGYEDD